jgi:hypothetical protein
LIIKEVRLKTMLIDDVTLPLGGAKISPNPAESFTFVLIPLNQIDIMIADHKNTLEIIDKTQDIV